MREGGREGGIERGREGGREGERERSGFYTEGGTRDIPPDIFLPSPLKFDNYMYTEHQYIYEYSFTFYI